MLALIPVDFASTLGTSIVTYSFAYFLGANFEKIKKENGRAVIALFVIAALFFVRIVSRHYFDGTILYDKITTYYTMMPSAFCIFYFFACFFEKEPSNFVKWFGKISFEVYLYHYMFCVGPLRIFGLTPFWITDCLLVTVIAVMLAGVMNKVGNLIIARIAAGSKNQQTGEQSK